MAAGATGQLGNSAMARAMRRQPDELRRLLADEDQVASCVDRLRGRRIYLVGTGTSWHAAHVGEFWLRLAGQDAMAVAAADAELYGPRPGPDDALVLISHRGSKIYTLAVLDRARAEGVPSVLISRQGSGADLETVANEESSAHTASYLGSLARLAQLAVGMGADLGPLEEVPAAVAEALDSDLRVEPPDRLIEFIGAGPNQWTAVEGALKIRETAYVASEGLNFEQFLHGPSVALRSGDALVALNGGGPAADRLATILDAARANSVRVHDLTWTGLGEALSVFPLTVFVQRIALHAAQALGTNPDSFGLDLPGRRETWGSIRL